MITSCTGNKLNLNYGAIVRFSLLIIIILSVVLLPVLSYSTESLIVSVDFKSLIQGSVKISPDSRRVAYVAKVGNKQIVVVDGKKGKQYDGIVSGSLVFSPDSERVAYAAMIGNMKFVVVDGKEGKQFNTIVRGKIVFDSDENLHYLALSNNQIFLEEMELR